MSGRKWLFFALFFSKINCGFSEASCMRRILITFLAAETFLHQEKVKQKDQRENSLLYSNSSNTIVLGRDIRTEICREVVTQRSLSIPKLALFRFS